MSIFQAHFTSIETFTIIGKGLFICSTEMEVINGWNFYLLNGSQHCSVF